MATKIYLPATASTTGITPNADSGWEDTSILARVLAKTTKVNDTLSTVAFTDANSVDRDVIFRQYIAPLKKGQTITGGQSISAQCRVIETTTGNNMFFTVGIRIVNQDGTVQKTVLAVTRDNTEASATTLTNRSFTATSAATNYTTVAGDYLVIEIGMAGDPTGSSPHSSSMRLGDSAAADLAVDDTGTTDNNPWVQLTDTLTLEYSVDLAVISGTTLNAPSAAYAVSLPTISGTQLFAQDIRTQLVTGATISSTSLATPTVSQPSLSFGYYRSVTIDHTKVPGTVTNFPVLIDFTDVNLKTEANGGHCKTNFDIRPYSDSALTTPLSYELESYSASTGRVRMWVKIGSVSSSTDTVFYLAYAEAGLTGDGSHGDLTWSNGYIAVYHLGDGSTLSSKNSVNGETGTITAATAATGQIYGAGSFDGSTTYISYGDIHDITASPIGVTAWIKPTTFGGGGSARILDKRNTTGYAFGLFDDAGNNRLFFTCDSTEADSDASAVTTGSWQKVSVDWDGSTANFRTNTTAKGTPAHTATPSNTTASLEIGRRDGDTLRVFDGLIDELHLESAARSANWRDAEYNNQNSPSTFSTLGNENAVGGGITGAFISSGSTINAPTLAYAVTTPNISTTAINAPTAAYAQTTAFISAGTSVNAPTVAYAVSLPVISATAVFAGTVSPGPVTLTNAFIASGSQLFAPTVAYAVSLPVISGTVLSAPTLAYAVTTPSIAATALFAPTVSDGTLLLSLPAIASGSQLFAASLAYVVNLPLISSTALNAPSTAYVETTAFISSGSALFAPSCAYAVTCSTIASGSALFAPTAAYAINLPVISGTALYAGTVTPGPVSLTLSTIASGSAVFAPTAAYVVAPAAIGPTAQLNAPTTAYAVTLPTISGTVLSSPLVGAGLALPSISATSLFAPTLAVGAVTLSLPVISSTQLLAPATAYAITLPFIASGSSLAAPTAAYAISLPAIAATALNTPTVTTSYALTMNAEWGETTKLFAPTVSVGPVTLALPAISGTAIYAPAAAYAINLPAIASGVIVYAPRADYTITAPVIASTIVNPPVLGGGVSLPTIAATSTLYTPALAPGPVGLSLGAWSIATQLFAPTAAYSVSAPAILSGTLVFQPTLTMIVALPTISGTVLHAMTVAPGPVSLTTPLIGPTGVVYVPHAIYDQFLVLAAIASATSVHAMRVTLPLDGAVQFAPVTVALQQTIPATTGLTHQVPAITVELTKTLS